ncbi:unannotated protein [freshwater metagenome]|uniref:Probable DNA 3'-5' helicase RecG n=1 Tax=freshwater metagenome TaxID=449393 RepID=A0A6J7D4B6_9ZZZZ
MKDIKPPYAFASTEALDSAQLLGAPWRSPRPQQLELPIGVKGPKAMKGAEALGLGSVGDLLGHFPHRHEDRGEVLSIGELKSGQDATIEVEVRSVETRRAWKRNGLILTVATVADHTGPLEAVWFNQPWVGRYLKAGQRLVLHGRYEGKARFRVVEHEGGGAGASEVTTGIVPVHPASDGLPPRKLRELVAAARTAVADITEPLWAGLLVSLGMPDRPAAIDAIHFPRTEADYEVARRRLAFDELLGLQLDLLGRRVHKAGALPAPVVAGDKGLTTDWVASLPFSLTGDQLAAVETITAELASETPMTRLLMGEVGSGKTVVALHGLLRAVESGHQGMLMAPTETLASQHLRSLEGLLGGTPVSFSLLTGSTSAAQRRETLDRFETGELSILIGTHALLEPDVRPARLALCVVDEQHRFGVRQRERLSSKGPEGKQPHVLHMTATPIPRTLALAAYGDLQTLAIRELPSGRQPVATHIVEGAPARARAYERIREEVAAGGRVFVVCPLVEASEALEASAATEEYDRLREGPLKGLRLGLLHGRMSSAEKELAMEAFSDGDTEVLVSTTVIEVGVDVPEATVMMVENAERFGLAQLHQLRGRVGRGSAGGVCLLCGSKAARRLVAMEESSDGFVLAELDLELRGEGELTGVRQSGLPRLKAASLPADLEILEQANKVAKEILATDPDLLTPKYALLGMLVSEPEPELSADRIVA